MLVAGALVVIVGDALGLEGLLDVALELGALDEDGLDEDGLGLWGAGV